MGNDWTHIRIRKHTLARLQDECHRLARAVSDGHTDVVDLGDRVGGQLGCGVSADQLLTLLLNSRARHRERRKKHAAGKAVPQIADVQETFTLPAFERETP